MSDNFKKLTGKNPKDFEPVAYSLINNHDEELFKELVDKDDYLFDFVKANVINRLEKFCNNNNCRNLIYFFKYYCPTYEDFMISVLAKYADEDLTDELLDLFEKGSEDEKTYCAKYFSIIQDPLALDFLKKYAYSENSALSSNCASALAAFGQTEEYEKALLMLSSEDEYEKLSAVSFLVAYGDKDSVPSIINAMKTSSVSENIAIELAYLTDIYDLISSDRVNGLYVLNNLINSLGDISGLYQIFDFRLYDIFEFLKENIDSKSAVVLRNAIEKFETLTENDEYLFDETKDVKQEVLAVKNLLGSIDVSGLKTLVNEELNPDSLFVFTALDFVDNPDIVRNLLRSDNQTLVLKSVEVLKKLNSLNDADKNLALSVVENINIKNVINAI